MKYELVLQFRGGSLADYDAMVALERELVNELGDSGSVDGHDIGRRETNVFIRTSDPAWVFRNTRNIFESRGMLNSLTAAFRHVNGGNYTRVWPEGSKAVFRVK